jgi:PAS domain S-box-containing protein
VAGTIPPAAAFPEPVSILLVDDRRENLVSLVAILTSPDRRLVTASSGDEALSLLLLREDFALILLDVSMPAMDGFEVARRLKESERTKHIPIIFVTAIANEASQVAKGYAVGAVDYLIKPLDLAIVRRKVGVFVDLYREREKASWHAAALSNAKCRDYELRLAELRVASDRRYRSLVEGIDGIIVWSANAGTKQLSFVSRRAQRLLGYAPMEFVAPDFWARHVHPEDRRRVLATFDEAIVERMDKQCVHRFVAADGRELWFSTGVSVHAAIEGGATEIHGISVDITEMVHVKEDRNLLRAQFEEARRHLLELANDLDDAIVWEIDADTMRFLFVSNRSEAITGFPSAEWTGGGEFWSAHMPAEDWETLRQTFGRSRSRESGQPCEHQFVRRDGVVRRMRTTIHFRQGVQGARFQGLSLDVTGRREAKRDKRDTI